MSSDARRKELKRLKREKKKSAQRRAMSVSPYKRIGQVGEVEACYINADWRDEGVASIHVVRRNPAGGYAVAAFLIDLWCAGLKDAWGRLDLTHEDVENNLDRIRQQIDLERTDPQTVRHLVAASIRFARQNGFRLPSHYDRWTNFLGQLPDINTADVSAFGKDGKLHWVGSLEDLHSRLIACTPEEFLRRPDVEFTGELSDWDDEDEVPADEDDDTTFDEMLDLVEQKLDLTAQVTVLRMTAICQERGEPVSSRLKDAMRLLFAQAILGHTEEEGDQSKSDQLLQAESTIADETLRELIGTPEDCTIPDDLKQAIEQAARLLPDIEESGPALDAGE